MTTQRRDDAMTVSDVRKPGGAASPNREERVPTLRYDTKALVARTWLQEQEPTESERLAGDPRALRASRLLAAAGLLVSALIHARLAFQLGVVGFPLGRGQLFLMNALASAALAMSMFFTRNNRVWLFAVVLSGAGLLGILTSVYLPIAAVGPFPAIDEPAWLLTKAVCALAELTVIVLWLIRQIAPASPPE